jgi:hypothetical protein
MFTRIKGHSQRISEKINLTSTWMLSNNIKLLKFWNVHWNSIYICPHTNQTGSRKLLLEKMDYLVSSIPTAVRGTTSVDEEALPPVKRRLDGREGGTMMNPRGCGGGY